MSCQIPILMEIRDSVMSKRTQFLTVNELKSIMKKAIPSDARVLVNLRNREYVVERVGQFHVVPNITMNIKLSPDGNICNPDEPTPTKQEEKE
jgi:hypothetical protein